MTAAVHLLYGPAGSGKTRRLIERYAETRSGVTDVPNVLALLTPREVEVFRLVARGMSNAEIAERLVVTEATVKTHARRLFRKLAAADRAQAVALGFRWGFLR